MTPGSVSVLALVNDSNNQVTLVFDEEVHKADKVKCHSLKNTETLSITSQGIGKFLERTGHQAVVMDVPGS